MLRAAVVEKITDCLGLATVNQLLDLAKLEHGKLIYSPVCGNIILWMQYLVESHQSLAETKNIRLTFYSEIPILEMDYDPSQLSKVISNLLTNAIKFTKQGSVTLNIEDCRLNIEYLRSAYGGSI